MSISEIIRYVYVTVGVALLFFIPIICIRRYSFRKKGNKTHWKYEIANTCFIFYLLCLYQITALRLGGIGWDLNNMLERRTRVNYEPLFAIWNWAVKGVWWYFIYNVIGNCLWFVPLGVLLPAIYKSYRGHLWYVAFMGVIISSSIEILQYVLCTGVTDIDDVICNTIGTVMGYGIWVIIDKIKTKVKKNGNHPGYKS